jgi:hypothetical protein
MHTRAFPGGTRPSGGCLSGWAWQGEEKLDRLAQGRCAAESAAHVSRDARGHVLREGCPCLRFEEGCFAPLPLDWATYPYRLGDTVMLASGNAHGVIVAVETLPDTVRVLFGGAEITFAQVPRVALRPYASPFA